MDNFSNEAYYRFFSALADRINLTIIDALMNKPKGISEISKGLNLEKTVISSHIRQLEKSVIIRSEEPEKEKLYSLNREIVEPLSEILEFHTNKYCPGLKVCIPPEKIKEYLRKEAAKETFIEH
jgi:DNA-binding transcriptional ArsR family regulator